MDDRRLELPGLQSEKIGATKLRFIRGFAVHWQSGTHRLLPRSTAGAGPQHPRPAVPRTPYT
jgi:hypothetical protein